MTNDDYGRWKLIKELVYSKENLAKWDAAKNQKTCNAFCNLFSSKIAAIVTKIHKILASGMLPTSDPLKQSILTRFVLFGDVTDKEAIIEILF